MLVLNFPEGWMKRQTNVRSDGLGWLRTVNRAAGPQADGAEVSERGAGQTDLFSSLYCRRMRLESWRPHVAFPRVEPSACG